MTNPPIWATTSGVPGTPHVVLIHGSLDRSAGMLKLSRRLDQAFRVTRYDRRGYGRSMPCDGPFDIDAQVADLVDLLRNGDERSPCVLFGHSYGGNVALATAQRHPDLVAGVAIYESPLPWLPWWPDSTAGADATSWSHDPETAAERFMRRLLGDARWDRLPSATREARRSEGPALVGELDDLRRRRAVVARGDRRSRARRSAASTARSTIARRRSPFRRWFGCDLVIDPRRPSLRTQHPSGGGRPRC